MVFWPNQMEKALPGAEVLSTMVTVISTGICAQGSLFSSSFQVRDCTSQWEQGSGMLCLEGVQTRCQAQNTCELRCHGYPPPTSSPGHQPPCPLTGTPCAVWTLRIPCGKSLWDIWASSPQHSASTPERSQAWPSVPVPLSSRTGRGELHCAWPNPHNIQGWAPEEEGKGCPAKCLNVPCIPVEVLKCDAMLGIFYEGIAFFPKSHVKHSF